MSEIIELAQTHSTGPDGSRQVCQRPSEVRSLVGRLQGWRLTSESCGSCLAAPAVSVRAGLPLCGRCRGQRAQREASQAAPLVGRGIPDLPDAGPRLHGHAIVTNRLSLDLGGFRERIMPEALTRTLQEGLDVRALWNHNTDLTLGRLSAGTLRIQPDSRGLLMEVTPPSWAGPQIETVARGDVTGQSFGFRTLDDEWFVDGDEVIRHVLDMRVSEVSIVSFPAYPDTTAASGPLGPSVGYMRAVHRSRLAKWA